ncbi:16S rRNA (cytosine(1402)-N(4))-methyltransferase RsmH [Candidatus Parcubacteria bacterium]|nr:16S rRNA (cytosine(1402)-N(4))-methyltransferase RsmH [Candidatus Parcubacteria bacterium]
MKNAGTTTAKSSSRHIPVLLHEVLSNLNLKEGDIFLDGTLGSAGHSAAVAREFGDTVEIIGLDRDVDALARSEAELAPLAANVFLRQSSFRDLDQVLQGLGVGKVNAILLDLGLSSDQLEDSGRGFSFQRDEPLEMTMEKDSKGITAKEILNNWDEETLELILRGFGEEKYSRKIAREIVMQREEKPFKTTGDLLEAVHAAVPASAKHLRIHPATRTFQAIRIAVNEELTALEEGLVKAFGALVVGGRLAVISFHSLEDRIVKNAFRDLAVEERAKLITKRPIVPTEEEVAENPRSRSAKLRVLEKII